MRSRPGGMLAALVILVSSCGGGGDSAATSTSPPEVTGPAQDGDVVGVFYIGTLDDGSQFDSNVGGEPLVFTLGTGREVSALPARFISPRFISRFKDAVRGRSVGDTITVRLEPADAYGERSDDNVIEVSAAGAPEGLEVGDEVQLKGVTVVVLAIGARTITVDANHPLAGQALTFEITIDSIAR